MPNFRLRYPAIPPGPNTESFVELRKVLDPMRETVQTLTRTRGRINDSAVTIQDLLDLGLINKSDLERLQ